MIVSHTILIVSGLHDNGMTPSQMHDGDQTVEITAPENAIDDAVTDIVTIYPPWPTDTDDLNDIDQMTNYKSIKDIRDELCKDTPQKTEINKPYICHATGMEETPKVALDIHCLRRGGGAALT